MSTPRLAAGRRRARARAVDRRRLRRDRHATRPSANLRWANNTLTTNGVMRGRRRHGDRVRRRAGGTASGGSVTRQRRPPQARSTALVGRGGRRAPARPTPAEDARRAGRGDRASRRLGRRARPRPTIDVFDDVRPGARRGVRPRRRRAAGCSTASSSHELTTPTSARRPGCGCGTSSPPGTRAAPARPPTWRAAPGSARATRDFTDVDAAALDAELAAAARLGRAPRRPRRPAATTRSCRRRAVADLMIDAYWTPAPATRTRASRSTAGAAAAPGSASGSPRAGVTLYSRPGARRASSARRSSLATRPSQRAVGLRQRPAARRATDWIRDGELDRAAPDPRTRPR